MNVDFHTHTTFSDGALTPTELIRILESLWVLIASFTDHDTMRAYTETINTVIRIIRGIEITTHYQWKTLHLLAYGLNPNCSDMIWFLDQQRGARRDRAVLITELLNRDLLREGLGPIPLANILALEVEWPITRPDIAQYLFMHGYVKTFREAFDRWLKKYDAPLMSWTIREVLSMVHDNGWTSILAHPFAPFVSLTTIVKEVSQQVEILLELKKLGLHGVEGFYSDMSQDKNQWLIASLNTEHGLLVTGWSDFHGGSKTTVNLPGILLPKQYVDQFVDRVAKC